MGCVGRHVRLLNIGFTIVQQEVSQHCIDTWNNITQLAITVHFALTSSYVTRECHKRLRERLADRHMVQISLAFGD
jgi:hypothetical protein